MTQSPYLCASQVGLGAPLSTPHHPKLGSVLTPDLPLWGEGCRGWVALTASQPGEGGRLDERGTEVEKSRELGRQSGTPSTAGGAGPEGLLGFAPIMYLPTLLREVPNPSHSLIPSTSDWL